MFSDMSPFLFASHGNGRIMGKGLEEGITMLKVAHFVRVTPHAAGLYESTREICMGQRQYADCDARLIDVEGLVSKSELKPRVDTEERGCPISNMQWAVEEADVHILHTGIPTAAEGKKPLVQWMHGLPEYAYYSQMLVEMNTNKSVVESKIAGTVPFSGSWTLCAKYVPEKPYTKGCITCWERHTAFWQAYFKNVITIDHFVDLEGFQPNGKLWSLARKAEGTGLNILWADHWRYTAFKDPFQVIHGVAQFCRATGSKLHLWAMPTEYNETEKRNIPIVQQLGHPWNIIYHQFSDIIGDMFVVHSNLDEVYRAVDLVVTTSCDNTRLVLEAQACGTPVLARSGADVEYTVDWNHPKQVNAVLERLHSKGEFKATDAHSKFARQIAEKYTLEKAAKSVTAELIKLL